MGSWSRKPPGAWDCQRKTWWEEPQGWVQNKAFKLNPLKIVAQPTEATMRKARISVRARSEAPMIAEGCQWRKHGQNWQVASRCDDAITFLRSHGLWWTTSMLLKFRKGTASRLGRFADATRGGSLCFCRSVSPSNWSRGNSGSRRRKAGSWAWSYTSNYGWEFTFPVNFRTYLKEMWHSW